jgi:hypothetical protein
MKTSTTAQQTTSTHAASVELRVLTAAEISLIGAAGVSVDEFPVIPR